MTKRGCIVLLFILSACFSQTEPPDAVEIANVESDSEALSKLPVAPLECTKDSACRLQANYCDGCECVALGPSEKLPPCKGTVVACFVDPCRGQVARCDAGVCVAAGEITF